MVRIDGSHGEGGGQILRTSLALAALTGQRLAVVNIRAARPKPGLRAQHLSAVRAMQKICDARLRGAVIGSSELTFEPGAARGGEYVLDVAQLARSAGSTTLIFQALLPALSLAAEGSHLTIRGGTHVAWSPPYHYLAEVFLPTAGRMGIVAEMRLRGWGWYPRGQGEIEAKVESARRLSPLSLEGRLSPERLEALSASSNLPAHVRERQRDRLLARLAERGLAASCRAVDVAAVSPGSIVYVKVRDGDRVAGFSALGEKGKPAEKVADEAADLLFEFLDSGAAVDEHLADQLIPYMALAEGESSLTTSRISGHLLTNIWVVESFLGKVFRVEGEAGSAGRVVARGVGFGRP